jgi:hypothetical protein
LNCDRKLSLGKEGSKRRPLKTQPRAACPDLRVSDYQFQESVTDLLSIKVTGGESCTVCFERRRAQRPPFSGRNTIAMLSDNQMSPTETATDINFVKNLAAQSPAVRVRRLSKAQIEIVFDRNLNCSRAADRACAFSTAGRLNAAAAASIEGVLLQFPQTAREKLIMETKSEAPWLPSPTPTGNRSPT